MSHFIVEAETYSVTTQNYSDGLWIVDAETEEEAMEAWIGKYNAAGLISVVPVEEYAEAGDDDIDIGFIDFSRDDG